MLWGAIGLALAVAAVRCGAGEPTAETVPEATEEKKLIQLKSATSADGLTWRTTSLRVPPEIYSGFSPDGETWSPEAGVRVTDPLGAGRMAAVLVGDTYWMFHASQAEG